MERQNDLLVSVGNLFLSLSATLVWGGYVVIPRPHLFITATISACFYIFAQMLASALWFAIPPLKQEYPWVLFLTVTIQELMRWLMFTVFNWMSRYGEGVKAFLRDGTINRLQTGFAVGVGYALLSVLISYTAVVADNYWFDQSIYMPACPEINVFVAGAALALAFSIMHMALALLVWPMYALRRYIGVAVVYVLHLGTTMAALGNRNQGGCTYTMGIVWALVGCTSIVAAVATQRTISKDELAREALAVDERHESATAAPSEAPVAAKPAAS
mmetsp:Transcript_14238/g.30672  ORF Transcript_14238/g.30672 Transcript_14238/m.30672 type:complete len:273 (-) Transcript_14238:1022-1840(-)